MSSKISDKQLLKKYNQIWKRVEKLLKIELYSKPVYGDNDKYIKTKIKIYAGSMITNFQSKKLPKEKVPCRCLSIMLDSVIKAKKIKASSNTLGRMQIWTRKDKNGKSYWWWLTKSLSDESGS